MGTYIISDDLELQKHRVSSDTSYIIATATRGYPTKYYYIHPLANNIKLTYTGEIYTY